MPGEDLRRSATIALVSLTILLFQIAITRILSVILWYHWAFLAISIAMLGIGAPGVLFAVRPPRRDRVGALLVAASVLLPVAVAVIVSHAHRFGAFRAVFCMVLLLLPMLALGAVVCLLLLEVRGAAVGRLYGWDLVGAFAGAVLVIPALGLMPTPRLVALLGVIPAAAALIGGRAMKTAAVAALVPLAVVAWGSPLEITRSKMYDESQLRLLYEKWTPIARLTVFDNVFWVDDPGRGFAWGMGDNAPRIETEQYWLDQDAGAGTPITRFDGDPGRLSFLLWDVTSFAYQAWKPRDVAVIGAGGGRDVLTALVAGAEHVDAIELNPEIVAALSSEFREFSGDVYHRDGVEAVVSEGRSYLQRTDRRFDLIQISLIDSWAATAAGAFALSESNLYTVEAYRLYWNRLTNDGVVSTSRWVRGAMGIEVPRLLGLIHAALTAEGVEHPERHVAVATAGRVGTVVMSRKPIDAERRARLREVSDARGFDLVYPDGEDTPALLESMITTGAPNEPLPLDLSPPRDDRPFFFHVLPAFRPVDRRASLRYSFNGEATYALQLLMMTVALLTVVMFFSPFVLTTLRRGDGFWRGSAYFACIGLGFMLIEVPWLQRFILFVGHPSHATTVVLASLLLGAGCGSLASARLGLVRLQRFGLGVAAVLVAVNLALPVTFDVALGAPLAGRIALAAALMLPAGFVLGLFFPLGMVRFGDDAKAWFWAVNGACGVLASIVSLGLAMELGFARLAWIAVGLYVAAWLLVRRGHHAVAKPDSGGGVRRERGDGHAVAREVERARGRTDLCSQTGEHDC